MYHTVENGSILWSVPPNATSVIGASGRTFLNPAQQAVDALESDGIYKTVVLDETPPAGKHRTGYNYVFTGSAVERQSVWEDIPPLTDEQHNANIQSQIEELEQSTFRALRESATGRGAVEAKQRLEQIDDQIIALRTQLR